MCIYIYLVKKNHSSVFRNFSNSEFSFSASSQFIINRLSSIDLSKIRVLASSMAIPLWVRVITVSLLSIWDVALFTSFFNSSLSMILGTFELFSIIRHATSLTHICSGYLPFSILNTLYCSCVNPNSFNSLLITVFSHQAVYSVFNTAFCTSLLNFVLCMACSSFTIQMYVYTFNYPNNSIKKSPFLQERAFLLVFYLLNFWLSLHYLRHFSIRQVRRRIQILCQSVHNRLEYVL